MTVDFWEPWPVEYDGGGDREVTSRYRGVSWNPTKNKWEACSQIGGRRLRSYHDSEWDAALAVEGYLVESGHSRRPWVTDGVGCVPLTQGRVALVDPEDLERLVPYLWSAAEVRPGHWYAVTRRGPRNLHMHRLLMETSEEHPWVDHKNGNGLDNRQANLRPSTRTGNNRNRRAMGRTSGYIGVSYTHGRWEVHIHREGRAGYVGRFTSEVDAARAYDREAFARDPEFARLNFPEEHRCVS